MSALPHSANTPRTAWITSLDGKDIYIAEGVRGRVAIVVHDKDTKEVASAILSNDQWRELLRDALGLRVSQ